MMKQIEKTARIGVTIACTLILVACGDAKTTDKRGYTKAPLEKPGVIIKPEGTSAMDSLRGPLVPQDTIIPAEQTAAATTAQ